MTVLGTGFSISSHKFSWDVLGQNIYMANDWDPMQRWDGFENTLRQAGIASAPQSWVPAPATAAGVSTPGVHQFRYRYRDSDSGFVSNPSNQVAITILPGAEQLTFTVGADPLIDVSADPKVDEIVLEATVSAGAEFFQAATVPNAAGTVVFDITDDTLVGQELDWDDDGHDVPPYFEIVIAHKGRLIGAGKVVHTDGTADVVNGVTTVNSSVTPDWKASVVDRFFLVEGDTRIYKIATFTNPTQFDLVENYAGATANGVSYRIFSLAYNILYESKPLEPESWPPLSFTKALVNTSDKIRSLVRYHGDLLVIGETRMERWGYDESIVTDGQPFPISGNRGAMNHRVTLEIEGVVYGWDRQGMWSWSGGIQEHISEEIDPLIEEDVNFAVADTFHAVEIPIERTIRWYYASGSDTKPKNFFEYCFDKGQWATGNHEMEITSSETIGTGGERRAILGDSGGFTWYVIGTTEGVDPTTTIIGTVAAVPAPAAGQFDITGGGLQTTGLGLQGVPIHWVEGDETQLASANTATQITLASPFTGAPNAGDTIHVGRIVSKLKTKAISLSRAKDKWEERYLHVYFEPTTDDRTLLVRVYEDYSATAETSDQTIVDLTDGVDSTSGSTDFQVDLRTADGYAKIPLGQDWQRTLEIEFEVRQPISGLLLLGFDIDGMYDEVQRND